MDELSPPPDFTIRPARGPRPLILAGQTLALLLIPAFAAVLALLTYDDLEPLVGMPPPPTVFLAGAAVGLLQYLKARDLLSTLLFGLLAGFLAWVMTVGLAIVIGFFEVLECFSPNGGCLPW